MAYCGPWNIADGRRRSPPPGAIVAGPLLGPGPAAPEPPNDQADESDAGQIDDDVCHDAACGGGRLNRRRRLALLTTVTEDMAMAAPAMIGLSKRPVKG